MNAKINHQELENDLSQILSPIKPSNDFVTSLQGRLNSKANIIVEYPNYLLTFIVIFTGLFLGVGLLWILSKLFKIVLGNKQE